MSEVTEKAEALIRALDEHWRAPLSDVNTRISAVRARRELRIALRHAEASRRS